MPKVFLITIFSLFLFACNQQTNFVDDSSSKKNTDESESTNQTAKKEMPKKEDIIPNKERFNNKIIFPVGNETEALSDETTFTISGTASPNITQVEVFRYADNCEMQYVRETSKTLKTVEGWEWEQQVTNKVDDSKSLLLCEGQNEFVIRYVIDTKAKYDLVEKQTVTVFSNVKDNNDVEKSEMAQKLKKIQKNLNIVVEDDPSIMTEINNLAEACRNLNLSRFDANGKYVDGFKDTDNAIYEKSVVLLPFTQLNNSKNTFVEISTDPESSSKSGHYIKFYKKNGDDFERISDIPSIPRGDCTFPSGTKFFYYNPQMIVIDGSPVFESYPLATYFNGEKWIDFSSLVKETLGLDKDLMTTPFSIKANKNYIG